ncbi:hypothetical protein MPER_07567 [Moniliophthora perniciosa FA553]|nr:hypothetical protein MPER_07567 [Moniliophthora perniciosa FA553]
MAGRDSASSHSLSSSQFNDIDQTPPNQRWDGQYKEPSDFNPRNKPIPESPSFYTGRATYHDTLAVLQNAVNTIHAILKNLQLLPLPDFARDSLNLHPAVWKPVEEMADKLECKLTTTRYQKITTLLNQLNHYLAIANTAGYKDLAVRVNDILSEFESGKASLNQNRGKRAPVELDQYGRSYTVGKRKTSAARVWMIPVRVPSVDTPTVIPAPPSATAEIPSSLDEAAAALTTEVPPQPKEPITVTASTILVNNLPISEYFPGVVGKYNVFIIALGGGTTGQSGAIAHGIAKGIFAHEPESGTVLRRAKLLRRDPRMVERKKTGLAKARKRYTWVKR